MKTSPYEKLIRALIIVALLSIFLLCVTQCKAQTCSTPTDTATEGICTFHTIDTVFTGITTTHCEYFKPSTEYINLNYMLAQGSGCGPVQYSSLDINTYTENCDTLLWSSQLYPNPQSNTFIGPFDTTRYYIMCVRFKASCNLFKVCLQYNNSPLPITLSEFTAEVIDKDVLLTWITESEINSDYFIVEKADGTMVFMRFAKVYASGNSTELRYYRYLDVYPREGINYYRLTEYDTDGTKTIFKPKAVNITEEIPYSIWNDYDVIGRRIK